MAFNDSTATKQKVHHAFSQALTSYEEQAVVQKHASQSLAKILESLALPTAPVILEVGCGTGLFTRDAYETLHPRHPQASWVLSDLSVSMLEHCRLQFPHVTQTLILDGDAPEISMPVDLIISNLTFQWFDNLQQSLQIFYKQLAPGGVLAFSTLGPETFEEWREACGELGFTCGVHQYPCAKTLQSFFPKGVSVEVTEERISTNHQGAYDFVNYLKKLGANTPREGYQPLSYKEFRQLAAHLEGKYPKHLPMSHHLLYVQIQKEQ